MKAYIPKILQLVGLILLAYGIYQIIKPMTSVQNNADTYTTIFIGLASMGLGFFMGKNK